MKLCFTLLLLQVTIASATHGPKILNRQVEDDGEIEDRKLGSSQSASRKRGKRKYGVRRKWQKKASASSNNAWSADVPSWSSKNVWNPPPPIRPAATPLALPERREKSSKSDKHGIKNIYLQVTNLAFDQPFSSFFVLVHDAYTTPLFEAGKPASQNLAALALDGDPKPLVDFYGYQAGVASVGAISTGDMRTFVISLQISPVYECVTIAAMMTNTNDNFVALNAVPFYNAPVGEYYFEPAYDAGVEENNELCSHIPGPACPEDSGNLNDGNGEGVVHVARPLTGLGDLSPQDYAWLNPVMQVRYLDEIPAIHGLYRI